MRVLSASVLAMEAFVMAFAILLAMGENSGAVLTFGGVIVIMLLLNAGLMNKKIGWVLGSILQVGFFHYLLLVYWGL